MGTIAAPDLATIEQWYGEWLGYSVIERGDVDPSLAASWGTPKMSGHPYLLMQPESGDDVYLRAVQTNVVPGYRALTTYGWNAFELVVDDVYRLNERLLKGPFEIIGPPQSIGMDFPSIHAMQVVGPGSEALYLTCDTGPKEESLLPEAGALVGRLFIAVISGADIWAIHDFYTKRFAIEPGEGRDTSVEIINNALGLSPDQKMGMTFVALGEEGNFIEIDGYPPPAKARQQNAGELPPGNAILTFSVQSLDGLDVEYLSEPTSVDSVAYGGGRTATLVGPVGELIELVEENR